MSNLNLKRELELKDEQYNNTDHIFGMTLLTSPAYVSSSRSVMFTSHLRQFVNLKNPDFPRVFTNYENIVGKYSTGYYKVKNKSVVVDKIPRFNDGINNNHLYYLFLYDKKNDKYDVVVKQNVEDLTEKFGYEYNNEVMDSKNPGDIVQKDEVLYKSTSYDEDMNYCYGKNVKVMYTMDTYTIEDALVVSESFAKSLVSKEIETVKVSINDNDILCNIYGDSENYKCFPDIGEFTKENTLCAKRRIHNNQALYDLKKSNLRKINYQSDNLFYIDGKITDIVIYSNKTLDEVPDNIFNRQLKHYLTMQTEFYERLYERCRQIVESGSKYSKDISFYMKKAKNILDPNMKWKEENSNVFSNMIVEFLVEKDSALTIGQKITGRQGNKGVVSDIRPDDEMPFLENGERVQVMINSLSVPNRTNPDQLFELSKTFICNRVSEKLKTMKKLSEKEELLFDIIERFNPDEARAVKEWYKNSTRTVKKEFFEDAENNGIYIKNDVMWEHEPIFETLTKIYKDYPWIKPVDVYINKFGRKIKIMKPVIVGELYMIKLKQTSKKGFSARSTGALSKRGVPDKSFKNKSNQDLYSTTPIRIGIDENLNANIGASPEMVAKLHLFYRSSVIARKSLGTDLASTIKPLKDFTYDGSYKNRNVEILQAYLKFMGVKIEFMDKPYMINVDFGERKIHTLKDGTQFEGTTEEFKEFKKRRKFEKKYNKSHMFIGDKDEYDKIIDEAIDLENKKKEYSCMIHIPK